MNAQQRTLDDLKTGINVQIDKSGRIRHRQQPQMGLPSVDIIDRAECEALRNGIKPFYRNILGKLADEPDALPKGRE